ncbi:uncharacterized protein CTRU02_213097 [Colletotrichum truncatum]|uniref:Uncharacterized protein n=1 Tax=Colletotrichum truncatum TaxID=5467 RepID=A0ACC3YJU6_COLTU|nr:uncharacterized protein CTRU02_03417 [Colletotrichum truncatum]KAF6797386.1 hypothetical protein CTRU02_03417 [Colletotrichum truncatum]
MSGIPFTAGMEASGGWPSERGPMPKFEPGPADFKEARKAEKRAEKQRQEELVGPSMTTRMENSVKSSFLGKIFASDPDKPKKQRIERNRDGVPIN